MISNNANNLLVVCWDLVFPTNHGFSAQEKLLENILIPKRFFDPAKWITVRMTKFKLDTLINNIIIMANFNQITVINIMNFIKYIFFLLLLFFILQCFIHLSIKVQLRFSFSTIYSKVPL